MIRRLALAGLVSAALGGTLLTAPPAMAAQSANQGAAVVTAANMPEAGQTGWRGKRRHCRHAHRRHCRHGFRFRRVRNIHIHIHNKNLNANKNANENRERDRHHDWWDWD